MLPVPVESHYATARDIMAHARWSVVVGATRAELADYVRQARAHVRAGRRYLATLPTARELARARAEVC